MASGATLSGNSPAKNTSRVITIVLLIAASVVAARFIWHYAFPYFLHYNAKQFDYYWPRRLRLVTHISGGVIALTCGTLQLWTGLRRRAMNFHRWIGRVYLVGAAIENHRRVSDGRVLDAAQLRRWPYGSRFRMDPDDGYRVGSNSPWPR